MPNEMRRYSLQIPTELFDQVQSLADEQQTTVVDLLRRFIKLGLMAAKAGENTQFIVRTDGVDREIVLL